LIRALEKDSAEWKEAMEKLKNLKIEIRSERERSSFTAAKGPTQQSKFMILSHMSNLRSI
jgi:hypothetical protein